MCRLPTPITIPSDNLNRAPRDMAQQWAETARQAGRAVHRHSGLSVALKAMQDNMTRNLTDAEAANAKAKLLAPTRPEQDDPNIVAAMAQIQGKGPTPVNLNDRLAALRQKQVGGPAKQIGAS